MPCAPVNTVADAVRTPQVAARHMVVDIADPAIGRLLVAGNPIKIDGVPDPQPRAAAARRSTPIAPTILAWLDGLKPERPALSRRESRRRRSRCPRRAPR